MSTNTYGNLDVDENKVLFVGINMLGALNNLQSGYKIFNSLEFLN